MMNTPETLSKRHPASPANAPARSSIDSKALMRGLSAVEIEHAGQRYVLRVTRENKLILTK
jgi:hemin uptake protein HemP